MVVQVQDAIKSAQSSSDADQLAVPVTRLYYFGRRSERSLMDEENNLARSVVKCVLEQAYYASKQRGVHVEW